MKLWFPIAVLLSMMCAPAAADEQSLPAPTAVVAVQTGTDVEVSWQPVVGAQEYSVVASPGDRTCESQTTVCLFSGLPARQKYTFTVTASSTDQVSAASQPSEPLWLRARLAEPIFERDEVFVGKSARGRQIVARRQGDPLSVNVLLVVGQMHGSEPAGLRVVKRLRRQAVDADAQIWTIRTMNPDGAARRSRYNVRGVDLNRNFPGTWRRTSRTGHRAGSEPETRAMMRFISRLQPTGVLSFHQPWNTTLSVCDTRSAYWVRRSADLMGLRPPGTPRSCGGWLPGTMNRWTVRHTPAWFVTVELTSNRWVRPQVPRSVAAVLTIADEMATWEAQPAGVTL